MVHNELGLQEVDILNTVRLVSHGSRPGVVNV